MRSFSPNKACHSLFVLLFFPLFSFTQTKSDFALSLMNERDYFRAISIYKELAFYSTNTDSSIYYLSQIGKAYRLSRKYDLSLSTFSSLLSTYRLPALQESKSYINVGLSYLGQEVPSQSLFYLEKAKTIDTTGIAPFFLGYAYCKLSDWERAKLSYQEVFERTTSETLKTLSRKFLEIVEIGNQIPQKNPLVSSILSSIFPGAGQFYCGHYVDGLQAFAFVSTFAFASYAMYKYDKKYSSNYALTGISISITALFHFSNIWGAGHTAAYYNQRQKELFFQEIEEKSLNVDF
jgi:tetratricopeptide (TPR) repeat protein